MKHTRITLDIEYDPEIYEDPALWSWFELLAMEDDDTLCVEVVSHETTEVKW